MMKIISIVCISLLLAIGLSACGNDAVQPSDLEADGNIAAPVESSAQEETTCESEEPAPPPALVSEEWVRIYRDHRERVTTRQALYEGGEELVFHWDAVEVQFRNLRTYDNGSEVLEPPNPHAWRIVYLRGVLTIENSAGEFIQEIHHPPEWYRWGPYVGEAGNFPNFADLNFDGYLDIYLADFTGGMAIPVTYLGYVWNPELGRFTETRFHEIYNFRLDEENQVLRNNVRRESWQIWRFIDGDFVMTNELMLDGMTQTPYWPGMDDRHGELWANYFINSEGRIRVIHYERELVNGEMVDAWPLISDTEEGRAIIYEHLFGEDSIWFPGQVW